MPEVQGYTTDGVDALIANAVVGANIDPTTGVLTLHTKDGSTITVGSVLTAVPASSTTVSGVVELATDVETVTGTDSTRAVTPFGLAARVASDTAKGLVELATDAETATGTDATRAITPHGGSATYQPKNTALTTIAGLAAPIAGDVLGYAGGTWGIRSQTAQISSLQAAGLPIVFYNAGSGYAAMTGPATYVGPSDPGAVAAGSLWFDTTGA